MRDNGRMRSIRGQCVVIPAWLLRDPASCVLRAMRAHEALRRCVSASCVQTQHEQSKVNIFLISVKFHSNFN